MDIVWAPFTAEQVEALNAYQVDGWMHPFTCGPCRDTLGTITPDGALDDRLLVATVDGWVCPTCDYTQNWAHAFMADADFATRVKAARQEAGFR